MDQLNVPIAILEGMYMVDDEEELPGQPGRTGNTCLVRTTGHKGEDQREILRPGPRTSNPLTPFAFG